MVARLRGFVNHFVNDAFPIEQSSMMKTHLLECEQIELLKWLESEKVGYDIGIYRARWIWLTRYRAAWVSGLAHQSNQAHS